MVNLYSDAACTSSINPPFVYVSSGACVPNASSQNSYKMTIMGSSVNGEIFSDLSCMTSVGAATAFKTNTCVLDPTLPGQNVYMKLSTLTVKAGMYPSGVDLGLYGMVFQTQADCNAFNTKTNKNSIMKVVFAQPYPAVGQSAGSPFGVPFNQALALSCSADGLSYTVSAWKTVVSSKTGALSVSKTTPAATYPIPLGSCAPVGYGPAAYYVRLVCV